ncbi:acyltransferase [Planomonospora sp. ID67723]|uniref:acyltransferase family protein n=1 Tax=Planomonospora sp. ID67723 TaxID=2738134 RepID=UPI0021036E9F|nr:acyltransferase [Planomonospora sp. ID67723]
MRRADGRTKDGAGHSERKEPDVSSTPPAVRGDLPALTGMRIIAALLVFLSHVIFPFTMGNHDPATPFADDGITQTLVWLFYPGGSIGVSFFFILSGFVITWSAKPGDRIRAYYRRRVVKIMPNHVVTWALAMLLFAGSYTALWGLPNLLLLNPFTTDNGIWGGANMPAWSLSAEMLFYLLFPALIIPIRKIADNRLWLWAGVAVAGMAAVCLVTLTLVPDAPKYPGEVLSLTQFWFVYLFPPVRLFEFVLGMILARIVIAGRWPRIGMLPVTALLVAAYAATLYIPWPYSVSLVTAVPFALAIGTFAKANLDGRKTFFGTRPMVWLGQISFGFYLTQSIVLYWLREAVLGQAEYGPVGGTLLIIALAGATVVTGWLLYTLVERPAMKYWSKPRKPSVTQETVEQPPVGALSN